MVRVKTFNTKDIMQNASKVFKIDDKEIALLIAKVNFMQLMTSVLMQKLVCQKEKSTTVKLSAHFMGQSLT